MNNTSTDLDSGASFLPKVTNGTTEYKTLEWKIKLVYNIVFLFIAVVSNFLVIVIVYSNKTKPKSPHEHFICNLSFGAIFALPGYSLGFFKVPVSFLFCKIIYPTTTVGINVTLYSVTAIAVFRCRAILNPFKSKPRRRHIYGSIAGIWMLAHVYVIPMYIVLKSDKSGTSCTEHWSSQNYNQLYTIVLTVVQYVIPLAILTVSYTRIVLYLKRHKVPQCGSNRINQLKMTRKRDVEVIKISVIIVLLHTILNLPGQVGWIAMVFENYKISQVVLRFSNEAFVLYCCCNPFVYGIVSSQFRTRLYNGFHRCCSRRNIVLPREERRKNNCLQELDVHKISENGGVFLVRETKPRGHKDNREENE